MRKILTKEFGVVVNSATVHKQLAERYKKPDETYRQFLYSIVDIAKNDDLKEDAIISYVIDGIKDTECNKAMLYTARTIEEIKV